ncbi:hypothetical protein ADK54_42020 [Streptomyces sp. WM6378]|nr:hypothetical protein ADK54_42020 [Streptomyces sp. WM6378]
MLGAGGPALRSSAAGARSHRLRHGLRSQEADGASARASHRSAEPFAAHVRSVHTYSTVAGRGFTEKRE